ncbi:hypothetical protein Lser_V15G20161 [Lactuca serriola]
MSPKKNNQPLDQTPTLQIDAATFQAAVSAAVSAILTHLNANNANISRIVNNNSNPGNNQVPQRATNYHDTPSPKTKCNKQKAWDKSKDKSLRRANKKQPPVTTFTATTSVPPTTIPSGIPIIPNPARQYVGNIPKCIKCSYHHHGPCGEMQCSNCNRKGHTIRYFKSQTRPINQVPSTSVNQACYGCGKVGHYRKNCPEAANAGTDGSLLPTTAAGETTPEPH